ncbi:MAG: winged helix-turn-helix domain-containing protein, partial [Microbacterium sp.]|nr:winged helix-turn-helix domain-containing protein [Microbacterium sp.]
ADAAARLADELRIAATWQQLDTISVSGWGDAVDDLVAAMPEATRHDARAEADAAPSSDVAPGADEAEVAALT